jgi:hypothetical protein
MLQGVLLVCKTYVLGRRDGCSSQISSQINLVVSATLHMLHACVCVSKAVVAALLG